MYCPGCRARDYNDWVMEECRISVADFSFSVTGASFLSFIARSGAFKDFLTEREPDFHIVADLDESAVLQSDAYRGRRQCYEISFEGIGCSYGQAGGMVYFDMLSPDGASVLVLYWRPGEDRLRCTSGNYSPSMSRFGLWMALNMLCIPRKCAAVHSSVNVFGGAAAMFLGESGTGKSTHTRLLRERYPEMFLLNDDSPFVRVHDDGKIMVYGSPWSGKTPCYRQECYPLKALVRLSQAPCNRIARLSPLLAIGALLPSAPPAFCYVEDTSDMVCGFVSDTVSAVPVYHLECLPDTEAAELTFKTVFCHGE